MPLNTSNRLTHSQKVAAIPDPVKIHQNSDSDILALKSELEIESHRQVHLLFGNLNQRKGIDKVLEAIALISPELVSKLCVLMVGAISQKDSLKYSQRKTELCQSLPVQITIHNQYVMEADIQNYFQAADVILASLSTSCRHERHFESSSSCPKTSHIF